MAQRGIENVRCKRCVRVIAVNNKFDIFTLVWDFLLSIYYTESHCAVDLVTYMHIY